MSADYESNKSVEARDQQILVLKNEKKYEKSRKSRGKKESMKSLGKVGKNRKMSGEDDETDKHVEARDQQILVLNVFAKAFAQCGKN